ncbi:MAG: KH domain-containing protein, partial [Casimicrobiaceae bacterium]
EALKAEIAAALPEAPALYDADTLTDRDERFLAAEMIREKIYRLLGDEVPYSTTVLLEQFVQEPKLRRISAVVLCDKPGQRAILVGEGGATMKTIATQARRDMEALFGGKVFLEVFVRVRKNWAATDASLSKLGY